MRAGFAGLVRKKRRICFGNINFHGDFVPRLSKPSVLCGRDGTAGLEVAPGACHVAHVIMLARQQSWALGEIRPVRTPIRTHSHTQTVWAQCRNVCTWADLRDAVRSWADRCSRNRGHELAYAPSLCILSSSRLAAWTWVGKHRASHKSRGTPTASVRKPESNQA